MKIIKAYSPNKFINRAGYHPNKMLIVDHITEGSATSCINWFKQTKAQASSHFLVTKKGEIYQFMPITDGSWANGTSCYSNNPMYFKHSTNRFINTDDTNANLFTVSIEHEGVSSQTKGRLTDAQYKATVWLHRHIIQEVKRIYGIVITVDREHIIGHYEVSPRTRSKSDPGVEFPFDKIISELKGDVKSKTDIEPKKAEDNRKGTIEKRFNKIDEIPDWAKTTIKKLMDKGLLKGDEKGNLDLSKDMIRLFVINDRAGVYNK